MIINFQNLITSLDEEIKIICDSELNIIKRSQYVIQKIRELEVIFKKPPIFKTRDEEVNFFKYVKPIFYSRLFYYNDVLIIECGRPYGGERIKREYLENYLTKIGEHFIRNRVYYEYHRMGATHFDDKYFTCIKKSDDKFDQEGYQILCEDDLSSSHDILFGKIISNDILERYLTNEMGKLGGPNFTFNEAEQAKSISDSPRSVNLKWTDSKTCAVEFIYAIHAANSLNNGKADIKEIATSFERMFNIQLGDFYQTFCQIKLRSNQTKYLDTIKDKLLKKLNEEL
jgi:hypothetical protein